MGLNTNIKSEYLYLIGGLIIGLVLALSLFSKCAKTKVITETEYIKGDSIKIEVPGPTPEHITPNVDTAKILQYCIDHNLFKEYFDSDTTFVYLIDTVKVVQDWSAKVDYNLQLFNIDTVGTCRINTYVQFNRLGPINTSFIPVTKVVTTRTVKRWEPFIGVGLSTAPEGSLYGGLFKDDWGFSIGYNKSFDKTEVNDNWSFQILKKF